MYVLEHHDVRTSFFFWKIMLIYNSLADDKHRTVIRRLNVDILVKTVVTQYLFS